MLLQARAAFSTRNLPPPAAAAATPANWDTLIGSLGPIENEPHILVIDRGGPELMCALLRAGAPRVTHLCAEDWLEADSASMILVPRAASLPWLEAALPAMRRALCANGRLVLCTEPLPGIHDRLRRLLTRHGFSGVRADRADRAAGRLVLAAELPSFGLRRCA